MAVQRVAHVGICVSDLDRSRRFYRDALGFTEVARLQSASDATRRLLQVPEAEIHAAFFERDGLRIELLFYDRPGAIAGERPRPMNQLGFTHLALRVDDLDATISVVRGAGGTLLEDTRMENPEFQARAAIALDPDGTRLELIEAPGDPATPIGEPVA
jgi:catechol 2,3-dioxygenase-like lactoylglutathione lyase family enzyme